jgi:hypothetical protein
MIMAAAASQNQLAETVSAILEKLANAPHAITALLLALLHAQQEHAQRIAPIK